MLRQKLKIVGIVSFIIIATLTVWKLIDTGAFHFKDDVIVRDTVKVPEPELLYGLPIDSFRIETMPVRPNQFLSDILGSRGIQYHVVDQLVKLSLPYFDFRKMNAGNKFTFFYGLDTVKQVEFLVYEINKLDYLKVSLVDSLVVSRHQKEVIRSEKSASGVIRSSLWKTIQENNLSPILAIQLSEVFAWSVDFFGISKGDYFKVLYQEEHVDGELIGIGKMHAAVFSHHDKLIYAFNFEQDGNWDFFDENGQSLRKAFLKAPLKFSRISSRFSNARLHPILKIRRPHHGIDYAAPTGTPVHTIGDGRIIQKGWDAKGGGNFLKIAHNSVYTTVYMHLSGFAPGLTAGQSVRQGQLIGYVGSTGLSSGPHLDFRVFQNGKPIDPLKVESPPVEPVKPENMERYKVFVDSLHQQLEQIQLDNDEKSVF
jgi:murein DD-endopeptidase MepM/ murein hydrolase activator NlpD